MGRGLAQSHRFGLLPRLAAWLGVLAVLAQMLMPLSQPQAAEWTADGLFPPTCSAHDSDAAPADETAKTSGHCQFCPVHSADRLLLPERAAVAAFELPAVPALSSGHEEWRLPSSLVFAAAPPRGPPAAL